MKTESVGRGQATGIPVKEWGEASNFGALRLLLAFALVGGAVLRLAELDLVSITADEGIHGLIARQIAHFQFEQYPLAGLPSVGIRNSAFFVYFLALPNLVFSHPLSGAAFIALLHVWSIWLVYCLGAKYFDPWVGAWSAVLFAFSPWAVIYARNMWPPSALTPFSLLFIGAGLDWYKKGSHRSLFAFVLLMFLLPQVHFSGFCGVVWFAFVWFAGRRWWTERMWATALAAGFVGLATWSPWIYWQHYSNHWQDFKQAMDAAKGNKEFSVSEMIDYYHSLLHTGRFRYWFRNPFLQLQEFSSVWLTIGQRIYTSLLVAVFIWSLVTAFRTRVGRLLAVWCLLPVVMLMVLRPVVHPHYMFIAFPIPYLLISFGVHQLASCRGKFENAMLIGATVVFFFTLLTWRNFVAAGRLDGDDRYQLSYRQRLEAVRSVMSDSGSKAVEIVGPFSGQQPAYSLAYEHEKFRASKGRWLRAEHQMYWMDELKGESLAPEAIKDLERFPPHFTNVRIEKFWKVGPTRIFRLSGDPAPVNRFGR